MFREKFSLSTTGYISIRLKIAGFPPKWVAFQLSLGGFVPSNFDSK